MKTITKLKEFNDKIKFITYDNSNSTILVITLDKKEYDFYIPRNLETIELYENIRNCCVASTMKHYDTGYTRKKIYELHLYIKAHREYTIIDYIKLVLYQHLFYNLLGQNEDEHLKVCGITLE